MLDQLPLRVIEKIIDNLDICSIWALREVLYHKYKFIICRYTQYETLEDLHIDQMEKDKILENLYIDCMKKSKICEHYFELSSNSFL